MPEPDAAFVAKVREQLKFLRDEEYNYDELHVYVSGIAEPWVFGPEDEFTFDGHEVMVVRVGPSQVQDNAGVPEYLFPIRHVVATQLALSVE
jgi:hypothetical protein